MSHLLTLLACVDQSGVPDADTDRGDSGVDTALSDTGEADTGGNLDSGDGSGDSADSGADSAGSADDSGEEIRPMALGIPAYAYPTETTFAGWVSGVAQVGGVMIVNPASGAGENVDESYVTAAASVRAAGGTVLGYVATTYGARDPAEIESEIGRYFDWYSVDGIFFDEVPGAGDACSAQAAQYQAWADFAHATNAPQSAFIAMNPGTDACEEYMAVADSVVIIEQTGAEISGWAAQAWVAAYPSEKFWLLAHSTPQSDLAGVVSLARDNNVGLVYITDDLLPNPWNALPTYFSELIAEISQ